MSALHERLARDGGTPALRRRLDPAKGASLIGEAEKAAVLEVLESKALHRYRGVRVAGFERDFAEYMGSRSALACSSGTAALRLGLSALGVGAGDEVIVPAVTFIACVGAVVAQGAYPVFCDVDEFLTLDPQALRARLSRRTKAVMPVHLFGVACRMDEISAVCADAGVGIIEDAAQACGARSRGRALGTFGQIGVFSFQQGKMITSGEGGALVTDSPELYERAVRYHNHGARFTVFHGGEWDSGHGVPFMGENFRLTELAGAILQCQLRRLDSIVKDVNRIRGAIEAGLAGLPLELLSGERTRDATGVGIRLARAPLAKQFAEALAAEGVPASRLYDGKPVYMLDQIRNGSTAMKSPAFEGLGRERSESGSHGVGTCPRAEDLVARTLGIAIGPGYSQEDVEDVVRAVHKVSRATIA